MAACANRMLVCAAMPMKNMRKRKKKSRIDLNIIVVLSETEQLNHQLHSPQSTTYTLETWNLVAPIAPIAHYNAHMTFDY